MLRSVKFYPGMLLERVIEKFNKLRQVVVEKEKEGRGEYDAGMSHAA